MINRTIKGYDIKQLIATGGMAAIYRATHIATGQTVAIKILHGHLAQDNDFIARFEREARAAAELKHDNIIMAKPKAFIISQWNSSRAKA